MYRYDTVDRTLVLERVAEYRDQVQRFLAGQLSEDEFRPLRLRNGLYIQRHAPMLRIAIPYGLLSSTQLRTLARIARRYDRGYGHLTTRQNIQFNWVRLEDTPDILAELAEVEMHAIQTSGNCVRNITSDEFAGIAPDEIVDPRALAEILRQWSTVHPEFNWLPRKFKIAVSGAREDRAATAFHDIGLYLLRAPTANWASACWSAAAWAARRWSGSVIREFLPWQHMLTYVESILRVYNLHGRRDNIYKARIKILVKALGVEEFARQVEDDFVHGRRRRVHDHAGGTRPRHRAFRIAAIRCRAGSRSCRSSTRRRSAAGSNAACVRIGKLAIALSSSHSSPPAWHRATSPQSRWNASPTGQSATASANCACRTNRT